MLNFCVFITLLTPLYEEKIINILTQEGFIVSLFNSDEDQKDHLLHDKNYAGSTLSLRLNFDESKISYFSHLVDDGDFEEIENIEWVESTIVEILAKANIQYYSIILFDEDVNLFTTVPSTVKLNNFVVKG